MLDFTPLLKKIASRERALTRSEDRNKKLRIELENEKIALSKLLQSFPNDTLTNSKSPKHYRGGLKNMVFEAIKAVAQEKEFFISPDIRNHINRMNPEADATNRGASISNCLKALTEEGLLTMVKSGSGRSGAVYKFNGMQPAIADKQ